MRIYGYVRVSSREQAVHGTSPDAQRDRIRAEAARRAAKAAAPEARRALLARVEEIRRRWARLDVAGRREVVRLLASAIVLTAGEPPAFTWRTPAELALDE